MTRGKIAMPAMKWLATLGLALLLPAAHATTAVVFSESTGRWGVAWNEPGKDEAIKKATEDCRYRGGGKDCKPIKVSDEPGFGAVAQTCAGGYCGISIITGRRSAADAERDVVRDCNKHYGVNNCYALDRWQETSAAPAPVAKAPPSTSAPQPKPSAPTAKPAEALDEQDMVDDMGCRLGLADSCFNLGQSYGLRQDMQKAAQLLDKACGLGSVPGCRFMIRMYWEGDGIRQDKQKAFQLADKLCGLGERSACGVVGWMYWEGGGDGIRQDKRKAIQLFDKACGLGDAEACAVAKQKREER